MLRKVQHSQVLHIKAKHSSMSQRTVQDLYEQSMQKTHSHILTYALITYTTHILTYALITYTSHIWTTSYSEQSLVQTFRNTYST